MKKGSDPRHLARKEAIQSLFTWDFRERKSPEEIPAKTKQSKQLFRGTIKEVRKIDQIIQKAAPSWPVNQISKVDLAILRLAIFELLFKKDVPPKVAIDEAIELAKEFGGETSPGFINGVLGTVLKEVKKDND